MLYRPAAPFCSAGIWLLAHCAVAKCSADDVRLTRKLGQPFYSGQILPTPKNAEYGDDTVPLADGRAGLIQYSTTFEYSGPTRPLLERLFEKRVRAYGRLFGEKPLAPDKDTSVRILFALASNGNASVLPDRYGLRAKAATLQPQGYLLDIRPDSILCVGKDKQGLVNALASLLQLMHVKEDRQSVPTRSRIPASIWRRRAYRVVRCGTGTPSRRAARTAFPRIASTSRGRPAARSRHMLVR